MSDPLDQATASVLEKATAWSVLTLAVIIGGGSMLAFGVFLVVGPWGLIKFDTGLWGMLAVNSCLSFLYFLQHSGMVRRPFKSWLARFVPDYYIGAFYSIASGLVLLLVVTFWQKSPDVIATATGLLWWTMRIVLFLALASIVWSAASLKKFDALGLRPIRDRFDTSKQQSLVLAIRGPYRWVRHPQYLCVILMIWAYPQLTVDRLLFNVLWTIWIVIGTWLEERDLAAVFGDQYRAYQQHVPMLIPRRIGGFGNSS